jgi:hypothetical protein
MAKLLILVEAGGGAGLHHALVESAGKRRLLGRLGCQPTANSRERWVSFLPVLPTRTSRLASCLPLVVFWWWFSDGRTLAGLGGGGHAAVCRTNTTNTRFEVEGEKCTRENAHERKEKKRGQKINSD